MLQSDLLIRLDKNWLYSISLGWYCDVTNIFNRQRQLRIDRKFCSVHEKITSIRLYTPRFNKRKLPQARLYRITCAKIDFFYIDCDRIIVGYAISTYHYQRCEFESC
jgi:hypothetical protein